MDGLVAEEFILWELTHLTYFGFSMRFIENKRFRITDTLSFKIVNDLFLNMTFSVSDGYPVILILSILSSHSD